MQKLYLCLAFTFFALSSQAQTFFEYDQAGNRIRRNFTPVPDLVLGLNIGPSAVKGGSPVSAVITFYELNNVPTTGQITIYLTKNSANFSFSFNPSATSIGGQSVQNANWTFDATSNSTYYILTTTSSVAAGSLVRIGLSGATLTGQAAGILSFSAVLLTGSGGELNDSNNLAANRVNYFPN